MARYKVILTYDGTNYLGFQRQGRARTVQAEIEAALQRLGWQGRILLLAGRTDTGVHASGQVAAFDLDWTHSPQALNRALNAHLPEDIAIRQVEVCDPTFHPRYDAVGRRYRYRIYISETREPLFDRYAWRVEKDLDFDLLLAAARLLVGTHDFAAFGTPPRPGGSSIRVVHQAGWARSPEGFVFEVQANAFLYHMVRRMVFVQVRIAQGGITLADLEAGVGFARPMKPGLAPPQGLSLTEVLYARVGSNENNFVMDTLDASGDDDGQDFRP